MHFHIEEAKFIKKYNRFLCAIEINGNIIDCHIPNTGRLGELLFEGNRIGVRFVGHPNRKTNYELILANKDEKWYCVDSRMPNALVKEWAKAGFIKEWDNCTLTGEKTYGNSRFDFKIEGSQNGYIEVKGVTLEHNGIGYFPDAPTERGRKHLEELLHVKREGMYSAVVFVCQSETIKSFKPNDVTDPEFGQLLRKLHSSGVAILAFQGKVTMNEICFGGELDVIL